MTAALRGGGPDARRPAAASVLRGPAGRAGPRLRRARRRRLRAPRRARGRARSRARARPRPTCCTCTTSPRINAAAERVAPGVPVVGHLHGTELLMLEAIEEDPDRWAHGPAWAGADARLGGACRRLIVLSDSQVARAERLLGVDPARCVRVANGFDPETFRPAPRRPPRALAARPRGRAARLGARGGGRLGALRRGRPGGVRRRPRRDAGAALRRPLHGGQADRRC